MRSLRSAAIVGVWLALLAAGDASATRYASPTGGTTEPCAQVDPCSLSQALEGMAKAGDEVEVLAGGTPYTIASPISVGVTLHIHGPSSGPLPEIDYTANTKEGLLTLGSQTSVSRLHLVGTQSEESLVVSGQNTLDDLILEGQAPKETLAWLPAGALLRNSVLWSPADVPEVTGVSSSLIGFGPATIMRNDTIELPGQGSIALSSAGSCIQELNPITLEFTCSLFSPSPNFDVANTILRGGLWDLQATSSGGFAGRIEISHSNYRATKTQQTTPDEIVDAGANQSAAEPALTSDFHEQPGSITVDAGAVDPELGALDPDGNPRVWGAAPDIGAFEFVPPSAPGDTAGAGNGAGSSTQQTGTAPLGPGLASAGATRGNGAKVVQTLGCAGQPGQSCHFKIVLTVVEHVAPSHVVSVTAKSTAGHKRARLRVVHATVGALDVTLMAGQVITVRIPLNATGKSLLANRHRLPLTVSTRALDVSGKTVALASGKITLTAVRKGKHRKAH